MCAAHLGEHISSVLSPVQVVRCIIRLLLSAGGDGHKTHDFAAAFSFQKKKSHRCESNQVGGKENVDFVPLFCFLRVNHFESEHVAKLLSFLKLYYIDRG